MQIALGPHSVVSQCMSVMALRVLPYGRFRIPRKREFTYEDAADASNEFWINRYERDVVAIRDILAGRVVVDRFAYSSNLEVMIDLIFTFLDLERENWTRWKHRYSRMEKNFAKNLYNAIIGVRCNINWNNKGAKPPIDRKSFYKLMLCWGFEPFHEHLTERRKRTAQRHISEVNFYYETFNQEGQEEMRHQIDRDDRLPNVHYTV